VILAIAEHRDGALSRATFEAVAAAQQLAGGDRLAVVVLGSDTRTLAEQLAGLDVAEVLSIEHPALATYTADGFTAALTAVVSAASPTHVVLPHTYQTRDFAPMLAARLRAPIVTDVIGITGTGGDATFARPMFQGKLTGQVRPIGAGPLLRRNLAVYGLGGLIIPFVGIKAIDLVITALHLA